MDRRGFIKGVLMSATAGTALVKLASAQETQALMQGPVALGNISQDFTIPHMNWSPEVYVRAPNGVFLCVGLLREIRMSQGVEDILSWDGTVTMIPGLKRGELDFHGEK